MLNWKDITIEKLQEIGELDDSFNPIEKKAHIVAILTETPYNEVEKWTIEQLNKVDISFLDDLPKSKLSFKFKHKGKRYRLVKNAKEMKAHHFIELQELYKRDTLQALNEIIGCLSYRVNIFGRRIDDDYDEKVEDFKTLPVVAFYNYALFFFGTLSEVIKCYPNLFEGESDGSSDAFGWLGLIDRLAGGRRAEWDIILNMPLKEFLNTLSYHITIKREQQKRLEKAGTSFESYVLAVLNEML